MTMTASDSAKDSRREGEAFLCRLCLKTCRSAVNIFAVDEPQGFQLWETIKEIIKFDASREEDEEAMPETICEECWGKIRDFRDFQAMCIQSRNEFISRLLAAKGNKDEVLRAYLRESCASSKGDAIQMALASVTAEWDMEERREKTTGESPGVLGKSAGEDVTTTREPLLPRPPPTWDIASHEVLKMYLMKSSSSNPKDVTPDDSVLSSGERLEQAEDVGGDALHGGMNPDECLSSRALRCRKDQQKRHSHALRSKPGDGPQRQRDEYVAPNFIEGFALPVELLYKCPLCGRFYETRRGLTTHLAAIHDQRTAECRRKSVKETRRPKQGSAAKSVDPLYVKWGLRECSVVLTDIFPGGVGSPLSSRASKNSDAGRSKGLRSGCGSEDDSRRGEAEGCSLRGSDGRERTCEEHCAVSCVECLGRTEGGASQGGGKQRGESSPAAEGSSVGQVTVKKEVENVGNPFSGHCIVILDDTDDESHDETPLRHTSDGRGHVESGKGSDRGTPVWMGRDQHSPGGCSSVGGGSEDCEMDPLMLDETESEAGEMDSGGEDESVAGSCARVQVWPHLILRQKHDIETISDSSDDEDEASQRCQEMPSAPPSPSPDEDGEEDIVVEAVVCRGTPSVDSLPAAREVGRSSPNPPPLPMVGTVSSSLIRQFLLEPSEVGRLTQREVTTTTMTTQPEATTTTTQPEAATTAQGPPPPPFVCAVCGLDCRDKAGLSVHQTLMHAQETPRVGCTLCGVLCQDKADLDIHILAMHAEGQRFVCSMCTWTFAQESQLMQHVEYHYQDGGGLICLVCRSVHATGDELLQHMLYVHVHAVSGQSGGEEQAQTQGHEANVSVDPLGYNAEGGLGNPVPIAVHRRVDGGLQHWEQLNGGVLPWRDDPTAVPAVVPDSPADNNIPMEVVGQDRVVYDARTKECYAMAKPFNSEGPSGTTSSSPIDGRSKWLCRFCGSMMASKASLRRHVKQVHFGSKSKSKHCSLCNTLFPSSYHLYLHQRTAHSCVWRHHCDICGKGFKTNSSLKRHLLVHEKPAPVQPPPAPAQQNRGLLMWFACMLCGRAYQDKAFLEEHFKEHNNFNMFECSMCGNRFVNYDSLCEHTKACVKAAEHCGEAAVLTMDSGSSPCATANNS